MIIEEGRVLAASPLGSRPRLLRPTVPVVAITGTNGKTTTSRMVGHIAQRAGKSVGWSSTDGVYIDGELVEAGDFSGPSGAGQVLRHPGVQLAVTETARGGILRRGVGVAYNDVSVVTNISADHLGIGGIDTLDQLAEVKAVITKITKPGGWCVLNADDPRTFAMRLGTKAQVWVFSRDPDSPSGRIVLDGGGRVTTVLDGWVCVLRSGTDPLPVVQVVDVPMTLAGLSRVNVENTLAVTSAALALGFTPEQVADGLSTFLPGENNPGRMNIWTLPIESGRLDQRGDRPGPQRGRSRGAAGDHERHQADRWPAAARRRDRRRPRATTSSSGWGRSRRSAPTWWRSPTRTSTCAARTSIELGKLIIEGAAHAGWRSSVEHRSELPCLVSLVGQARDGDVVAMMTHQDRQQVDDWLLDHGATRDDPETLRAKVLKAES